MNLNNIPLWLLIIIFAVGAVLGAWGMHTWTESDRLALFAEKNKQPTVKETVKTVTQTEFAYIPKETIIYKDAAGNMVTGKEKTDVQADLKKTELNVKVNGKDHVFTKSDDEQQIFDKNKLAVTQSSNVQMAIEVPTIDKTKNGFVGVGINSKLEPAVTLGIKSLWLYGDSDTKAGGLMYRF